MNRKLENMTTKYEKLEAKHRDLTRMHDDHKLVCVCVSACVCACACARTCVCLQFCLEAHTCTHTRTQATDRDRTGGDLDKEAQIDALHQAVEALKLQLRDEEARTNQVMMEYMDEAYYTHTHTYTHILDQSGQDGVHGCGLLHTHTYTHTYTGPIRS